MGWNIGKEANEVELFPLFDTFESHRMLNSKVWVKLGKDRLDLSVCNNEIKKDESGRMKKRKEEALSIVKSS